MRSSPFISWSVVSFLFGGVVGCNSAAGDTATQAAALQAAQCNVQSFGSVMDQCVSTYDACVAAEGANIAACRLAVAACAPANPDTIDARMPPLRARREGDGGMCDGGRPPPPPPPPPPGDGGICDGARPPGGPMGEGDHDRGGRRGPGHHGEGDGASIPHPDPAALTQCRSTLEACLNGSDDVRVCLSAGRACVHNAFASAFAAACTNATSVCAQSSDSACIEITARCTDGVAPRNAPVAGCE